jgi:hypothetical protein
MSQPITTIAALVRRIHELRHATIDAWSAAERLGGGPLVERRLSSAAEDLRMAASYLETRSSGGDQS